MTKFYVIAFNNGGENQFAQRCGNQFQVLQFWGEATRYQTHDEAMADVEHLNSQINPQSIQIYHISDKDKPGEPMVDRKETVKGPAKSVRYS